VAVGIISSFVGAGVGIGGVGVGISGVFVGTGVFVGISGVWEGGLGVSVFRRWVAVGLSILLVALGLGVGVSHGSPFNSIVILSGHTPSPLSCLSKLSKTNLFPSWS
jgi:hypothetical protein